MHALMMSAILALTTPSPALHPPSPGPKIEDIKAFLFLPGSGSLSRNVLDEGFVNAPATPDASTSLIVTVRVSGMEMYKNYFVHLSVKQGKRIILDQDARDSLSREKTVSSVAFLARINQCDNVDLTASVRGIKVKLDKKRDIGFHCGE